MKVQISSKKFIKPSTPTPPNLRNYKISSTDELAPTINVPIILYYRTHGSSNDRASIALWCNQLKTSLEQTLTQFYPLAGRYIKDTHSVDCNDQGVEFAEAQVDVQLTELLGHGKNLKAELLNAFIPCEIGAVDEITDPLLGVQVTMFECGSVAIGLCMSHRIGDAATLSTFVNAWTVACRGGRVEAGCFNSPSFFPGRNLPRIDVGTPRTINGQLGVATRRFLFNSKAISALIKLCDKCKPSRVQLVFAVIWRALMDIDMAKHGRLRTSVVFQPVNLRGKTIYQIPNHSCGNLWAVATPRIMEGEIKVIEFQDLVDRLSEGVRNTAKECAKKVSQGEEGQMMVINPFLEIIKNLSNPEVVSYWFSSWCKFPIYEVDFGCGKPEWASCANFIKNVVFLMDEKEGDGIEAWVHLEDKDMLSFEQDYNIRAFTT